MTNVAILHPGRMGAAVAHQAALNGARVRWCPVGRSADSAKRADAAGLEAVDDLAGLLGMSEIAISLCPPAAADEVAAAVRTAGFEGIFVEANAVSPQRVIRISGELAAATVDGSVIGPPPPAGSATRLYLSGPEGEVERVRTLFDGTAVEAKAIDGAVGAASALKLAYASHRKAAGALAAISHALAATHGVQAELTAEARRYPSTELMDPDYLPSVAARAWRWGPEMLEVAETLRAAGLPDDLARAAAAVFDRWADDKDDFDITINDALDHLRQP
jgi:Domain of unknown function (DUF1932)